MKESRARWLRGWSLLGGSLKVQEDPDAPVERNVLAGHIVRISEAFETLQKSGLNEKAIIVLIKDKTNLTKGQTSTVLDGLRQLRADYCG